MDVRFSRVLRRTKRHTAGNEVHITPLDENKEKMLTSSEMF
jgi:hypothetical protein